MNKVTYVSTTGAAKVQISNASVQELLDMPDVLNVAGSEYSLKVEDLNHAGLVDRLQARLAEKYPDSQVSLDFEFKHIMYVKGVAPSGEVIQILRYGSDACVEMFSEDSDGYRVALYECRRRLTGRMLDFYMANIEEAALASIGLPLKQIEAHLGLGKLLSLVSFVEDNASNYPYLDTSSTAKWLELQYIGKQNQTVYIQHKEGIYQVFSDTDVMPVCDENLITALDGHLAAIGGLIDVESYKQTVADESGDIS